MRGGEEKSEKKKQKEKKSLGKKNHTTHTMHTLPSPLILAHTLSRPSIAGCDTYQRALLLDDLALLRGRLHRADRADQVPQLLGGHFLQQKNGGQGHGLITGLNLRSLRQTVWVFFLEVLL